MKILINRYHFCPNNWYNWQALSQSENFQHEWMNLAERLFRRLRSGARRLSAPYKHAEHCARIFHYWDFKIIWIPESWNFTKRMFLISSLYNHCNDMHFRKQGKISFCEREKLRLAPSFVVAVFSSNCLKKSVSGLYSFIFTNYIISFI